MIIKALRRHKSIIGDIPPEHHFPLENLPYGVGKRKGYNGSNRCMTRIGDFAVDLAVLENEGVFKGILPNRTFHTQSLNKFMSHDRRDWIKTREILQDLLSGQNPKIKDNADLKNQVLIPVEELKQGLPANIGDFTDFYSCKNHRDNCGKKYPTAIKPNYEWVPVAYHGRSSTINLSGTPFRIPQGQYLPAGQDKPTFGKTKWLDFEVEMGYFIGGTTNKLGDSIPVDSAIDNIFGFVILNDWTARDIQLWEMNPLGPLNSKNFMTTISPWVVSLEALQPFKVEMDHQDLKPLPYLQESKRQIYDIDLDVYFRQNQNFDYRKLSTTNLKYLYWSLAQQVAHHTETGCKLVPGDLIGTGTLSGTTPETVGSLIELDALGIKGIQYENKTYHKFLNVRNQVKISAQAKKGELTIGFGECTGRVLNIKKR